jgi:tetratricopeptide (TPR) repeat protein
MYAIKTGVGAGYKDGRKLEKEGDAEAAARVYHQVLKHAPQNMQAIQRLIVIYRKLKDVKNELKYIDAAIKLQQQYYTTGNKADKTTTSISNKLNKLLGHTDSKGKPVHKPEEIRKLELRKERLLARKNK